ncbi:NADH-quinone oxidoreductase subunit N [Bacillus mesophilus]|uniref:NADH-quinone oxidoreductase subunit N n=1 Tax=Bacillus mesophilus TaxID=1808955 RepID=A0A6M0Q930_9BACI|nr:NADH-quinone oxidoreductase subunit NuoN [Bacillus mesophilus]MBM7662477.1 NADH-quinone oxidoreductase subunit N [Bacillus mesophilus]NEY72896.1 NADH-quinone oxidoreductase subunit NuoN [Bacillus mesophilus]
MDTQTLLSFEWGAMAPEFIILGVATLLSLLDLFLKPSIDRKQFAWLGLAGIIVALGMLFMQLGDPAVQILENTYRLDSFSKLFKILLLIGGAFVMLLAADYDPREKLEYRGEFYYLFLTALLGAMIMASSGDLITLFVGLELLSISSYILAGLRKKHLPSNEAAMKYVINGGISTAIVLFGMSYIYGLTGSTNLIVISQRLGGLLSEDHQYIAAIAFAMVFIGLSFKLASAPFHMWAPDVYEGSPMPVTAFLSVVSKTAGFVIILRIFLTLFSKTPAEGGTTSLIVSMGDYIAIIAAITMIVGNTIALRQRNVKRLFAYSSIAHAGYVLVAFMALSPIMLDSIWFYLLAYGLMNFGAFAILQLVISKTGKEDISEFTGLYRKSPLLALAFGVFIVSLAGIPGTAGFIAKLNIFTGALLMEQYLLVSIMVGVTVISYVYYFGLLGQIFFRPANDSEPIKFPFSTALLIVICVIGTIGLGIFPNLALDVFHQHGHFSIDFFQ